MDKEKFEELCVAYVLHALEGEDLQEFNNTFREADDEMKRSYEELQWTAFHLPLSVDLVSPSPVVKENILRAIRQRLTLPQESVFAKIAALLGFHKPQFALGISFALVMGIVGLVYYTFLLREMIHQRDQQLTAISSELSTQRQRFVTLQEELTKKEEILKVLQSPKIDVVFMNGLEVNPAGYGKIIWDPEKKSAILQIANLPPVPKDKDYQLWVIKDKKPISAGVFSLSDPEKETFFKIEQLVEADKKAISAFAITLEPKGGVPQPTGKMYLLGAPSL